jgi:APA family basic amino acid/polyamine antiporter
VFGFSGGVADLGFVQLDWGALLIIAIVATLLAFGTKLSSNFSAVITAIKVAVVLLVVIVGSFYIKTANYTPFIPPPTPGDTAGTGVDQSLFSLLTGWPAVTTASTDCSPAHRSFFAFIGFDVVATTAEETKEPQRDVAKGILASLAVVTVLYVAVSIVLSGMVPYTDLKTGPDGKHANLATAFAANGCTGRPPSSRSAHWPG